MTFLLEIVDFYFPTWFGDLNECDRQSDQKNCQMSIKVTQNDFTRKMIDFDNLTKIA